MSYTSFSIPPKNMHLKALLYLYRMWLYLKSKLTHNMHSFCSIVSTIKVRFSENSYTHGLWSRGPVRKAPSLHDRKSTPTPKFLGWSIFCLPCAKFLDFFDLCLHWAVVCGYTYSCLNILRHPINLVPKMPQRRLESNFRGCPLLYTL